MKVGILGGGFDPFHNGHLKAAIGALQKEKLDEVWLMPYFKRNLTKPCQQKSEKINSKIKLPSTSQKREMIRLSIKKYSRLKVSDLEIERKGISYTIDTILLLKKTFPQNEFYWIIGEDLLPEISRWKNFQRLIIETTFLVFPRKKREKKTFQPYLKYIKTRKLNKISSTEIRKRLYLGKAVRGLINKEEELYIKKHNLYKKMN